MNNLRQLQLIILFSVTAICACYAHSVNCTEVVVYKCRNNDGIVRFQDFACEAEQGDQVYFYNMAECSSKGLRLAEQQALDNMHKRLRSEHQQFVSALQQHQKPPLVCNVELKMNNYIRGC